jgi:N6-adenosine-specific RNA methylase IME4
MFNKSPILPQKDNSIQSNDAFSVDKEIKILKKGINGGFIELAKRLKQVKDNSLYKELDYDTFESYIAQPELGFQRSSVYLLIQIYEKLVLELNVQPAGLALIEWTKLAEIVPYINEKNKEELLSKATELSRSDLREEVKLLKSPKDNIPLPEGKYNVVLADPPWNYGDKQNTELLGGAEKHYSSMTIEELCNIKVPVADNAILFLWVTSPLLDECWPIITAWGFEYKTSFVWDKVKHNMGHYNSVRHEFLLVCTRGSFTPENNILFDSVITEERSDIHSQKPNKVYEIIETLYPSGKYLEMFARNKRKGWTSWGNEI